MPRNVTIAIEKRRSPDNIIFTERVFVVGTRAVLKLGEAEFRVVCATCDGGGKRKFATLPEASSAAIKQSGTACRKCGAS